MREILLTSSVLILAVLLLRRAFRDRISRRAQYVLWALVLVRLLLMPMKLIFKVGIHSGCGFLCLWLLNSVAAFTGAYFPINAVTVLVAGFLGLPGIGVMALLEVLSM